MKISLARASLVAIAVGLAAAALGTSAQGQDRDQDKNAPESLLPPGFGDPVPTQPTPTQPPAGQAQAQPGLTVQPLPTSPTPPVGEDQAEEEDETAEAALPTYVLPDYARRDIDRVGVIGPDSGGLDADGYGAARGRFLSTVMREIDAPIASRWLSIALRRALMSRTATPSGVGGADFAAERAWLLLRMGEADGAQAIVQAVDVDRYTPKLFEVAMQAALAKGDPASLCPLADRAVLASRETGWTLVRAMCAGLVNDPGTAGQLVDQARRQRAARGIDLQLAEKVVGAGTNSRRSITIEWDGVDQLTAWRYGLATATNVPIPAALFATVGRHVQAWRALAPMRDAATRTSAAALAASLGVLGNVAYVDLVAAADEAEDATPEESALANDLADAYAAASAGDRMSALRKLWNAATGPTDRHARSVLTARAAARVPASADLAEDAPALIAAMLAAGLDTRATRWTDAVEAGSDGWAMLAVANPGATTQYDLGQVQAFAEDDPKRQALLLAGLAGLGRMPLDEAERGSAALSANLGGNNSWTRAIDAAARRGEPATVLLLAAAGMQTSSWDGVPPLVLFHVTSALRRVGLEGEARMIAAEAVARA